MQLLAFCICALWACAHSLKTCSVDGYGAKGDGVTLDTVALNRAAVACASGGNVQFTKGKSYLSGPIVVNGTGVTVNIPSSTTVLQSNQQSQYPANQSDWYLLYFLNCTKCSLTGAGTLSGQSDLWVTSTIADAGIKNVVQFVSPSCTDPDQCRPRLLGVRKSSQVSIGAVTLLDAIFWTLHVFQSQSVTIDGTNIVNDQLVGNNDGIDVDSSNNVTVRNVKISTCDDGICFKATDPTLPCTNVLVENCQVLSHASSFKLGTESVADFANITVRNSIALPGTHRALSIQLRDNGDVRNVTFTNITAEAVYEAGGWWGAAEALYITAIPRTYSTKVGTVSGVTVSNYVSTSENGVLIVGVPESPIQNVLISNAEMTLRNLTGYPGGFMDLRPGILGMRADVNDSGIYTEYVNNLELQNVSLIWTTPARPFWGLSFVNANNTLQQFKSQAFSILGRSPAY